MRKQIAVWLRACADQLDPPKPITPQVRVPWGTGGTVTTANGVVTWKETA